MSEVEHLKTITGIEGVPKFICAEDIPGLSTGNLHLGIHSNKNGEWIRCQIVTSSCGSHSASFHSKRELISALRDIVIGMSCFHCLS